MCECEREHLCVRALFFIVARDAVHSDLMQRSHTGAKAQVKTTATEKDVCVSFFIVCGVFSRKVTQRTFASLAVLLNSVVCGQEPSEKLIRRAPQDEVDLHIDFLVWSLRLENMKRSWFVEQSSFVDHDNPVVMDANTFNFLR